MPPFLLKSVKTFLCLPGYVTYTSSVGTNLLDIVVTIKLMFDTHNVFVVKASSSYSIFDFHPTVYFIRQMLPSMSTLSIVPKFM